MRTQRNQLDILDWLAWAADGEDGEPLTVSEIESHIPDMGRSSIYAALKALERDRCVVGAWDTTRVRPARIFTITEHGRKVLEVARSSAGQVSGV